MKKLIIILLLFFAVNATAQIDTANWSLTRDGLGNYSVLTNRVTLAGVSAGGIRTPLVFNLSTIDTSKFQLIRDGYGNYSVAINKASLYGIDSGKIRIGITYDVSAIRLNQPNTWTATQTYNKIFVDSLILRLYLLDTGTSVVRTILPQTTRLYNFGGSSNYWLNSYTQNLYVDTAKTDIVFSRDALFDSTLTVKGLVEISPNKTISSNANGYLQLFNSATGKTMLINKTYGVQVDSNLTVSKSITSRGVITDTIWLGTQNFQKGNGFIKSNSNLYLLDGKDVDWGAGNARIGGRGFNTLIANWDGSASDTTLYINGTDSSVTVFGDLKPSNNYLQDLGGANNFWKTAYINGIQLSTLTPRTSEGITIGSGVNPVTLNGVTRMQSMTLSIDSLGANKSDTAKVGNHFWIVNCDNTNNDTVYLSNVGLSGFVVEVKKIDANATYVVVMPKGGKTIEGTTEDKFNIQYQTRKYVYKNNAWWIF